MRIRIKISKYTPYQAWYTKHDGEDFEVIEILEDMIPKKYRVDVSRLTDDVFTGARGSATVEKADAEICERD